MSLSILARRGTDEFRLRGDDVRAACTGGLLDATDAKRFWEQNVTETRITITALGRAEALRLSAERARRMAIRGT